MSKRNMRHIWPCLIVSGILTGCAAYHPMPIDKESAAKALRPADMATVKVDAARLNHPLLKPVKFDIANGLSMDDAAILAVVANPELKAERDRLAVASAQVLKSGILPNPNVSMDVDLPTGGPTKGTVNAYNTLTDWNITSLVTRGAEIAAARHEDRSVALDVAWKEWQIAEAARLHFVRLYWAQKKYSLLKEREKDVGERLKALEKAFAMGNETRLNLDAARASCQQFRLLLEQTKGEVGRETLALHKVLGLPPDYRITIKGDTDFKGWLGRLLGRLTEKTCLQGLDKRRLDLVALKEGYQAQEERLRAQVLAQFPKINIGLLNAGDTGAIITTGPSVSIGLPVFDRNQGNIAIEKATRQRLFDEYMARLFGARAEVSAIIENMRSTEDRVAVLNQAVRDKRRLYDDCRRAVKEGNLDAVNLYQVLDDLMAKELELLKLKGGLCELAVALEAASGVYSPLSPQGG
ncbi:MAG: TolC family protein [Desulfobacteraceae bacterium]|nr:TolC family protein [Desulfobacteraceae bacterium]